MIEVDLHGQPVAVDEVDRDRLLDLATESERQEWIAARRKLRYALRWCHLNPVRPDGFAAGLGEGLASRDGGDCEEHIAGPGTPLVAAGSPTELGAALGIATQSAVSLMGNSLELAYRLPRTWARLEALEIPPWKARRLATWTTQLPAEGADWVDAELAPRLHKIGLRTIDKTVTAAVAIWRPDLLKEREAKGKDAWHVTLDGSASIRGGEWAGTSSLDGLGDTADFAAFADLVRRVAEAMRMQGDTDTLDQRRAKALGVIGRGEHEELLASHGGSHGSSPTPTSDEPEPQPAREPDQPEPDHPEPPKKRLPVPRRGTQPTTLYVHVTAADLASHPLGDGIPLGRVERLGPATLDLIQEWVGKGKVRIQPVVDLNRPDAVDQHDPPAWMREAVILRDQHCVFPWCHTDARACDLDHIEAYRPNGPPGQTSIEKLACLCRTHHNAKTHYGWRYCRLPDGTYLWTSPTGRRYVVDTNDGTSQA